MTRHWQLSWQLALLLAITVAGTWAATICEKHFGRTDPGHVVIDEVAGQLVTLVLTGVSFSGAVLGFFVFRIFDIVKPPPVNMLERLPRGYGIMADDLMAGVFGNLVMQLAVRLLSGVL